MVLRMDLSERHSAWRHPSGDCKRGTQSRCRIPFYLEDGDPDRADDPGNHILQTVLQVPVPAWRDIQPVQSDQQLQTGY